MAKKQMRLTKETLNKSQSYIPGGLDNLINEVKSKEDDGDLVRINCEVPEELRNAFKSKVAKNGGKIKDVMKSLMIEYVRKNETE